jgi:hypothetical protein
VGEEQTARRKEQKISRRRVNSNVRCYFDMKLQLSLLGVLLVVAVVAVAQRTSPNAAGSGALKTRCGWFSNPTPANAWLYDRDGEWTIGVQGGHQAEGNWPNFKSAQWVRTNGDYGYGCACFQLRLDKQTHNILEIKSARARPLAQCRRDPALKKWSRKLQ